MSGLARRLTAPASIALVVAVALALAWLAGGVWANLVARTAILALAAVSLSFLIGQAGLVSFGHAAPIGLGAYAALVLGESNVSDMLVVLPAAASVAAAFSMATGVVALRTRGVYFIMITLAFAQMAYFVAASLAVNGGDDGLALARRATLLGARPLRGGDFGLAALACGLLVAAVAGLERIRLSRFGLMLRAAKENEARMAASGVDAFGHRLVALGIAGGLAGLAGALLANQAEFVSPAYMNWHRSGELIVMAVLGGLARPGGAVYGAIAVVLVEEGLGLATKALGWSGDHWKFHLGLMIVAVVLLRGRSRLPLKRGAARG